MGRWSYHPSLCDSVHYYDKELFQAIAQNVSSNFTKFDTEQLLKV